MERTDVMKKYEMQKLSDGHAYVVENPTSNVMFAGAPREARPFTNKLNGGCGFNGFTPEFMFHRFVTDHCQGEQKIFVKGTIQ